MLPVHTLRRGEPYYLGVFLVGAYQEILGDLHNLFGDTNAVHLSVKDGSYHIDQIIDGETVEEVLEYVQYNPKKLVRQLEIWVTKSVKQEKYHSKKEKNSSTIIEVDCMVIPIWSKIAPNRYFIFIC